MRNKCIFSILLVTVLSAVSIVAFAASMGDEETETVTSRRTVQTAMDVKSTEKVETIAMDPTDADDYVSNYETEADEQELTKDERYMLAKLAMAEAEGEDTEGKALVIRVVLNRVMDDAFPDDVIRVMYQDGQFSPIENGRFYEVEPDEDCYMALELVESGWDESNGATFFESNGEGGWHSENLEFLFQHGNHYFYKE